MVATYVEIIVGVKLTNQEACKMLLAFSEEVYLQESSKVDDVFSDFNFDSHYKFDFKTFWYHGIQIFTSGCCSKNDDVLVGVSLRKLYRLKMRCADCQKYTVCDKCFNTTEQGIVDYHQTYNLGTCPPEKICSHCHSYNGEPNENCSTCKQELEVYDVSHMSKIINKLLGTNLPAQLYFHWNDCGSCT